jgi:hypothetical protein
MSETPFRDVAKKIAESNGHDYTAMQYESERARSHAWWRNIVQHGAWNGPGATRVGPPDPEALGGIAELFGTSVEQVSRMVAADWYGVHPDVEVSARVLRLAPVLEELSDSDADLVESVARRLATGS